MVKMVMVQESKWKKRIVIGLVVMFLLLLILPIPYFSSDYDYEDGAYRNKRSLRFWGPVVYEAYLLMSDR